MALFDMPLAELERYLPDRVEPSDFDRFWADTLASTRSKARPAEFTSVDFGLQTVETFDVSFRGFDGQSVKGWLLVPRHRAGPLPCVVEFIGYGGGRGFPTDWLVWSAAGFAHLVMDTRGQGSVWLPGDTPDLEFAGGNPQTPGFMTRGIASPDAYYYRRVIADGVRAVETAREHPAVDPGRIVVAGISQGGGISLAVSGLVDDLRAAVCDVPFLCHYRRATEITDSNPYQEIAKYCTTHRDKIQSVFATLDYFDGVNFAPRATASALFSTALMDQVCPPSTVFAAYNHYAGPKRMNVWHFNGHEGGGTHEVQAKLSFVREAVG